MIPSRTTVRLGIFLFIGSRMLRNEVYLETPKHEHKGIEAFNRGKITIQVGENFYGADVVAAIKLDGHKIFYDIVKVEKQKNKTPHDTYLKSEDDRGSLWESFTEP